MLQYGESKTTRIMMATVPHVTSGSGLRKFQAHGFFFDRLYISIVLPWFGNLWILPISKNEIEAVRTPVWYHWGDTGRIAEIAWHCDRKWLPGSVPKMKETVGPVSTCGSEVLRGWRRPIGLMVSYTIFTESVRKILDTTL